MHYCAFSSFFLKNGPGKPVTGTESENAFKAWRGEGRVLPIYWPIQGGSAQNHNAIPCFRMEV